MVLAMTPEDSINCLLIHPRFSAFSFWNYKEACQIGGSEAPSPPLGLITVAALLPNHWHFQLLDLNCQPLDEVLWARADLILVGGMLPQQRGILEIIGRARADGKYVCVGGADPSSQPGVYHLADAVVVGEGESAIPVWLDSWRRRTPNGVFRETEKPDVTMSPIPRYDLLNIHYYMQLSVQYSRGCPFNCEFCDIIELYGRKPRVKEPQQILAELDVIKKLGFSGSVDIVDDNFIGNKRNVKHKLLPALIQWNKENSFPFYYSTEVSMNLAADKKLMELMREAEFRTIFTGIETTEADILLKTQKSQNTMAPIAERIQTFYDYGFLVSAGFILGFDGEPMGMDQRLSRLIEETSINMAMIGLLVALPNTQLTRRLRREGRLIDFQGKVLGKVKEPDQALVENSYAEVIDQTLAGLNFVTTRDRNEILREFVRVVEKVYSEKSYFDRILRVGQRLKMRSKHRPRWFELKRNILGFARLSWLLSRQRGTRYLYWRNFFLTIVRGPHVTEQVMRVMGIYVHFRKQSRYLNQAIKSQMASECKIPLSTAAMVEENGSPPKALSPSQTMTP